MADHNSKLNGCAWIVGAVVLGTMIGRCSAAPEPSDEWSSGSELVDVQDAEPLETAYVSANGLNCRSRGALRSPVVSKLEQGEELQVQARRVLGTAKEEGRARGIENAAPASIFALGARGRGKQA